MRSRPFDGVLIDFYGTICAGDREAVEATCRRIVASFQLPLPASDFAIQWGERFFATVERSNHVSFRTLYECEMASLRDMLREFGVEADPAPFVAQLEAYWRDPPLHEEALEFLGGLNLPVCCVSNADTESLLGVIEKHKMPFDAVVCSESARCYKPNRGIFHQAIKRLGIRPERAIHIGDSLHSDVGGAAALGIKTAWVRRENRIHDIGNAIADFTVTRLDELNGPLSALP